MNLQEFKIIDGIAVNRLGEFYPVNRDRNPNKKYMTAGYYAIGKYLVHRLVAQAFVPNPDPKKYTIVNHIDGNKLNNRWDNLEWCNHRHNNLQAVYQGLQIGCDACLVRDFDTGIIHEFPSISEAKRYMDLPRETLSYTLYPSFFGFLIKNKYEFRLKRDVAVYPFFYQSVNDVKVRSRYCIVVEDDKGNVQKYYSRLSASIGLNLKSPKTISRLSYANLVEHIKANYPNLKVNLLDASKDLYNGSFKPRNPCEPIEMIGYSLDTKKYYIYNSIRHAEKITNCDQRLIRRQLNRLRPVNKTWFFSSIDNDSVSKLKKFIEENY